MIMNNEAWNKVTQTHDLFKKIIAPLKQHLGINFGYMIVFNDGSYYQIIEDLECLKKWVTNVETSHIFCARNVTTYFDEPYNFTIWPEEPTCPAMEIYKEHGMWNGVTVSKTNKDYTELYWFTKQDAEINWHKWFIRNKYVLYKFIKYIAKYKDVFSTNNYQKLELFRFKQKFNINLIQSSYVEKELSSINRMINTLELDFNYVMVEKLHTKTNLSPKEIEVLSIIGQGFPLKVAASRLLISVNTIKYHIGNIKNKTGIQTKLDFINFLRDFNF